MKNKSRIALIFPPLVTTNFGSYYPSIAVLAGYLKSEGFESFQFDLNDEFSLFLLDGSHLRLLSSGETLDGRKFPNHSEIAAAARLLRRNKGKFFDSFGRQRSVEEIPALVNLLVLMAEAYRMDASVEELVREIAHGSKLTNFYTSFYQRSKLIDDLALTADMVGISVAMGTQIGPALILARLIKACYPSIAVILGGPAMSLMAKASLDALLHSIKEVDVVVRYEGERPLTALMEQRSKGNWNPSSVPGCSARVGSTIVHASPEAGIPLDYLPYPVYDSAILNRYATPEIGIIQARGCYWGECSYCDFVELYEGSPPYRTRTATSFLNELKHHVEKYGIRRFAFITEALPPAFASRLSKLIIQEGLSVHWNSFAMVHPGFTDEVFASMAKAGCEYLVVGAETMSDRVLKLVRKFSSTLQNESFFNAAARHGVKLRVNIIPDLPSITYSEAMQVLDKFRSHVNSFDSVAIFPFEATRSSDIGRHPERFGLIVLENSARAGQAQFADNQLHVNDPAMNDGERFEICSTYRTFAAELSERKELSLYDGILLRPPIENVRMRYAEEIIDLIESTERGVFIFYNLVTRKRVTISDKFAEIVFKIAQHGPFTRSELSSLYGSITAEVVLRKLCDHRLLVVADNGP